MLVRLLVRRTMRREGGGPKDSKCGKGAGARRSQTGIDNSRRNVHALVLPSRAIYLSVVSVSSSPTCFNNE
eukprot:6191968-Pleurochrysis_carterae.AAC.2